MLGLAKEKFNNSCEGLYFSVYFSYFCGLFAL